MIETLKLKLAGAWRSFTIWFNTIAGTVLVTLPMLQDSLPQLADYLPAHTYKILMGVVIVANILLRFKTSQPLEAK
jgi:hypothetical protein